MQFYNTREILEKYGITDYHPNGVQKFITFMKQRGVEIELAYPATGRRPSYYRILSEIQDEDNEIWKSHPIYSDWEFSNLGHVRNNKTKKYYGEGQKTTEGYRKINVDNFNTQVRIHRGVMEAFNPIPNSQNYVVDHINGIRSDNRLENLRWVYQHENTQFSDENNTTIKTIIADLIKKYGYDETKNKLLELLNEK